QWRSWPAARRGPEKNVRITFARRAAARRASFLVETPSMPKGAEPELLEKWKIADAVETYGIRNWGKGYFAINKLGHVTVQPNKSPEQSIDLKELVDQLQARGIQLPILLRFTDILRHRVGEIHDAFADAIREFEYQGEYCCVYPIK